jgi:aerobic-type carbon monoxide dehydrogenase small subunit (CoxS/CutS family)
MTTQTIRLTVNGTTYTGEVEPRLLLADFIRDVLGLTGTHVGCEHGVCGACTIQVNGEPVRSCLLFAVQANGSSLGTIEGLAAIGSELGVIQQAFHEAHGLQCGFCTAGLLLTVEALLQETADPSESEIREYISGNLCRCTGYQSIVAAVQLAAERLRQSEHDTDR